MIKYFLIASILLFSSCYRMPTDEDFSVVPMTNNRDITKDKFDPLPVPGGIKI